jgi:hypothetical protein
VLTRHAIALLALVAASCVGRSDSLPDLAVRSEPPVPAMTPVPAPDMVCISRMGQGLAAAEPRKVRHVPLRFPKRDAPTRFSGTVWMGTAEIDVDGGVVRVRVVRPIKTQPPWPEWEDAIPAAIRQWKYEPVCVNGQPVKTELTVAVNINLR